MENNIKRMEKGCKSLYDIHFSDCNKITKFG